MRCTVRFYAFSVACALIIAMDAMAQSNTESAQNSIGIRGGYSWPMGDWSDQRTAPGVRLFKGSVMFDADMEFSLSDRVSLALNGGYSGLDASDWENYAKSRGDNVSVSASLAYVGLLLRAHVKVSKLDIIAIDIGPVVLFESASETFGIRSYEYDFFHSVRFGVQGGIEYDRCVSESVAVTLRLAGIVAPSGMKYADGESRTVIALPVTAGLRFSL